jgi:hypothetical protein
MSDYDAGYAAGKFDAACERDGRKGHHSAEWLRGYRQAWADAGKEL